MIQFNKPENLNGAELIAELLENGIDISEPPYVDASGDLWLNADAADKDKIASIVANHNGTVVAPEQTIEQKLASVGLSLTELKSALLK